MHFENIFNPMLFHLNLELKRREEKRKSFNKFEDFVIGQIGCGQG